jgi:photosystem II stability/assembly factor-like uncharacterized protein
MVLRGATAVLGVAALTSAIAACGSGHAPNADAPGQSDSAATSAAGAASPAGPTSPAGPATARTLRLSGISFATPLDGYGLFLAEGSSRCRYAVGRTSDGGARFTAVVAVASWSCGQLPPAQALAFDSSGDGFLYGPGLFLTHDAGASWGRAAVPGGATSRVLSVVATGRSVWLLEERCAPRAQRCGLRLMESADGGRSWRGSPAQPPGATASPAAGLGTGNPAAGAWLIRIGQSSAYVVSRPPVRPGVAADDVPIWFTSNGGASWSRRPAPCGINALDDSASVAPDGALFVACAGEPAAGVQAKSVARSTDQGKSWTVHRWCPGKVLGCPPLYAGYLGQIAAADARTAFLAGPRSSLMVTRDGSSRWAMVRPQIGGDAGGTSQVIVFSRSDAVVLGDGDDYSERPVIWRTSDGGQHWTVTVPQVT